MNTSKLFAGFAALGLMFASGSAGAATKDRPNRTIVASKLITKRTKVAALGLNRRGQGIELFKKTSLKAGELDFVTDKGLRGEIEFVNYKSELIERTPALQVLREFNVVVIKQLLEIPQSSVVVCGNTVPAHHRISAHITDTNKREQLRNWVKGGGEWQRALMEVLHEKEGA